MDVGLEGARGIGSLADDCGGVYGGSKSICGDTGLCLELAQCAAGRSIDFTLERVIGPAEPLVTDAPEATANAGDGVRVREVKDCLLRVSSLPTQTESCAVFASDMARKME